MDSKKDTVKAVIFDMDGLMFNTEYLAVRTWQTAASQMGYQIPDELFVACTGLNRAATKEKVLRELGEHLDYDKTEEIHHRLFQDHIEKFGVEKKQGLVYLLRFLKECQVKTAVATSTGKNSAESLLKKAEVYEFFDRFVFGDMVQKSKPEPDIFLKAAELLGVAPQDCMVLEDSYNGIKAAHAAGMKPVMIPDLLPVTEEIKPLLYKNFETLEEVVPLLQEML